MKRKSFLLSLVALPFLKQLKPLRIHMSGVTLRCRHAGLWRVEKGHFGMLTGDDKIRLIKHICIMEDLHGYSDRINIW